MLGRLRMALCIVLSLAAQFMPLTAIAVQTSLSTVRSAGMGNVYLSPDPEPGTVFTDPTGIAGIRSLTFSTVMDKPYAGLPGIALWSGKVSTAMPVLGGFGFAGLGYSYFQTDSALREQVIALNYAYPVMPGLWAGLTGKYLWHEYLLGDDMLASMDPVFANGTSRGVGAVDVGLHYQLNQQFSLGLAGRNLNQPNWGLASTDPIGLEVQAGARFTWKEAGLTAIADVLWQNSPADTMSEPVSPAVGIEKTFGAGTLAVRAGANLLEATVGLGVRWEAWLLDYAASFKYNLISDNYGSHRIGLSFSLGAEAPTRAVNGSRITPALYRPAPEPEVVQAQVPVVQQNFAPAPEPPAPTVKPAAKKAKVKAKAAKKKTRKKK